MSRWRQTIRTAAGAAALLLAAACTPGVGVEALPPVPPQLAFATAPTTAVGSAFRAWAGPLSTPMPDRAPVGGAPAPWLAFCLEDPDRHRCWEPPQTVALTPARLEALVAVQAMVNGSVIQREDPLGVGDRWTLVEPGGSGDCEDMALTKRDLLIRAGWPPGALRMAICYAWDQPRGGDALHAVLTVDTDEGTLVLGNLSSRVAPWSSSECRDWVMRQSGEGWAWIAGGVSTPLRRVPAVAVP